MFKINRCTHTHTRTHARTHTHMRVCMYGCVYVGWLVGQVGWLGKLVVFSCVFIFLYNVSYIYISPNADQHQDVLFVCRKFVR